MSQCKKKTPKYRRKVGSVKLLSPATYNLTPVNKPSGLYTAQGIPPALTKYALSNCPIPPYMRVYLVVYGAHLNNTANPGFADIVTTKINSLKNPVNGAHEYAYADELFTLYNNARIVSSALTIQAYAGVLSEVTIFPSDTNTAVTTIHGAQEHRWAKTTCTAAGGNKGIIELTQRINCADLWPMANTDNDFVMAGNNDPAKILYWHITSGPFNVGTADIYFRIKLIAEVIFSSPKQSTSSA